MSRKSLCSWVLLCFSLQTVLSYEDTKEGVLHRRSFAKEEGDFALDREKVSEKTAQLKEYVTKMSGLLNPLLQRNAERPGVTADVFGGGRQRVLERGEEYPLEYPSEKTKMSPWGTALFGPWAPTPKMAEALASPTPMRFWPAIDTFTKGFSGFAAQDRKESFELGVAKIPDAIKGPHQTGDKTSALTISGTHQNQPGGVVSQRNHIELSEKKHK
ncbi:MAG: uncharacterized protein A8A55_2199 [Amphiamblys sp. WSBS2006]|nr:MAG: uncharacterized protein A8A55_2199 [Amphiamblys sp. WSBS2006]